MNYLSQALYRAAQIRQAEQIAINELQISAWQLMQLAGAAAFARLRQRWPQCRELWVFCGAGNNGGDGYVLARLALEAGFRVQVYALAEPGKLQGDAQRACSGYLQAGGRLDCFDPAVVAPAEAVVVDALFGTGLNRPLGPEYAQAITWINASTLPVLAVDVPSGLHADTGSVMGCAVHARLTVTFIGLKCGLYTGEAVEYCGEIVLETLHLPEQVFSAVAPVATLLEKQLLPPRPLAAHKGRFGHVLLIGGNLGYSGAIRLAAEAALRSGAGLVSVASRAAHSALLNLGRPELMCHGVESATELQPLLDRASVLVIGPGLGQDAWAQTMFAAVINTGKPCVLDADALNLLAKQPVNSPRWLLTPHPGEAARLLGCSTTDISVDRYAAVLALQVRYGGVVVLKGAGSLMTDGQTVHVGVTGNPGMASGGMGDVLSGILAALLAQRLGLLAAACLGVDVHGEAADRVAARQGQLGMLASDLFSELGYCLCHGKLG
jgi:NAD(P)H-hydrate epimerase